MKTTTLPLSVLIGLAIASNPLCAATIISSGDALLNGATVITFDEVVLGSTDPSISGVSFSGQTATTLTQNNGAVPSSPFLGNQAGGSSSTSGSNIDITFSSLVNAFGADLYAVNSTTTLQAFDIFNNLLGSIDLVPTGSFVDGFVGLGGFSSGIASARIITTDYLGVDNFHVTPSTRSVPDATSTIALLSLGLAGIELLRRKKI